MKYLASLLALFLAAAFAPCAIAQADTLRLVETSAPSVLDDETALSEPRHIAFNMTANEVREAMRGHPDQKLAPDLWVYWHFNAAADVSGKFTTLVIYFAEGRVTKFRLVERKALIALLAAVKKAQSAAVAKK